MCLDKHMFCMAWPTIVIRIFFIEMPVEKGSIVMFISQILFSIGFHSRCQSKAVKLRKLFLNKIESLNLLVAWWPSLIPTYLFHNLSPQNQTARVVHHYTASNGNVADRYLLPIHALVCFRRHIPVERTVPRMMSWAISKVPLLGFPFVITFRQQLRFW